MQEMKVKKIYKAEVIKIKKCSISSYYIEIDCGCKIQASPGQFMTIYCEGLTLRRPFSIFTNDNGRIGFLIKERGKGTQYIKSLKEGGIIDIAGPFGNGFDIKNKKALLIGAGIGIAPVSFLKSVLDKKGIQNILAAGFLNKTEIPSGTKADKICTDDGSAGERGSIINYAGIIISEFKPEIIYACGPSVVLQAAAKTGGALGIETQLCMENIMACGIGVCRGCVIEIMKDGRKINASVCKDGPVFKGSEVLW